MAKSKTISREKLENVLRKAHRMFRHRPNFTGVDVGYVWTKGEQTNETSVRVHLDRKLPVAEVETHLVLPKEIDGLRIDVIEGNYQTPETVSAQPETTSRLPFLMGGLSISRDEGGAGTLGAIVKDRNSGRLGILSNWHVMAGASARVGDTIFHPAKMDAGVSGARPIARLSNHTLGLKGDAAVALLDGDDIWVPLQLGTFTEVTSTRKSKLGEKLSKHGRSSKTTNGTVDGEGIYRITYEVRPNVFEARDIEGFRLLSSKPGNPDNEEISEPGDSGSLWVHDSSGTGVGLHFAGETSALAEHEFALACNLGSVLDALQIDIATFDDLRGATFEQSQAEFTPRPDDPWPTFPPIWPPIGPWPMWPPQGSVTPFDPPWDPWRDWRNLDRSPRSIGVESNIERWRRIKELFRRIRVILDRHWLKIDMPVSILISDGSTDHGQGHTILARELNSSGQFTHNYNGADLWRNGGSTFRAVCIYIDDVERGES